MLVAEPKEARAGAAGCSREEKSPTGFRVAESAASAWKQRFRISIDTAPLHGKQQQRRASGAPGPHREATGQPHRQIAGPAVRGLRRAREPSIHCAPAAGSTSCGGAQALALEVRGDLAQVEQAGRRHRGPQRRSPQPRRLRGRGWIVEARPHSRGTVSRPAARLGASRAPAGSAGRPKSHAGYSPRGRRRTDGLARPDLSGPGRRLRIDRSSSTSPPTEVERLESL